MQIRLSGMLKWSILAAVAIWFLFVPDSEGKQMTQAGLALVALALCICLPILAAICYCLSPPKDKLSVGGSSDAMRAIVIGFAISLATLVCCFVSIVNAIDRQH